MKMKWLIIINSHNVYILKKLDYLSENFFLKYYKNLNIKLVKLQNILFGMR